jgi:ATP adenylyltransferase/5',5'''-P-1,P-4-tetraphosphate phosphorylase II
MLTCYKPNGPNIFTEHFIQTQKNIPPSLYVHQGTFSKADHLPRHKRSLNTYNKIEITLYTLSSHHRLKLNSNRKKKAYKLIETKQFMLSEKQVKTEIKREIKDFVEFNENENTTYPNLLNKMKVVLVEKVIALSAYIRARDLILAT